MAEHKRKRRAARVRIAFLCVLSAMIGSVATVYVLKTDTPIISKRPNPYSRPVQSAQTQRPSKLIVVDGDTVKSPFGVKYLLLASQPPST